MPESSNIRRERIERLLHELRYEVERGMMERDIDETMGFEFYVPISQKIPEDVVLCRFETRPVHRSHMAARGHEPPKLRLVGNE